MTIRTIKAITDKSREVAPAIESILSETMNFKIYRLVNQSQEYDGHKFERIASLVKRMEIQMRSAVFTRRNLLSIISILHKLTKTCDSKGADKNSAIWMLHYLMKDPEKSALAHLVSAIFSVY